MVTSQSVMCKSWFAIFRGGCHSEGTCDQITTVSTVPTDWLPFYNHVCRAYMCGGGGGGGGGHVCKQLVFYTQSSGTVISGRVCKQRQNVFYFSDVIKFTSVHCMLCQPACDTGALGSLTEAKRCRLAAAYCWCTCVALMWILKISILAVYFWTLDDEVAILNDRMPAFPPERPSQQEGGLASGEGDAAATDRHDAGAGADGHLHPHRHPPRGAHLWPGQPPVRQRRPLRAGPPPLGLRRLQPRGPGLPDGDGHAVVGGPGDAPPPTPLGQQPAEPQRRGRGREAEHPHASDEHSQWAEAGRGQHAEAAHEAVQRCGQLLLLLLLLRRCLSPQTAAAAAAASAHGLPELFGGTARRRQPRLRHPHPPAGAGHDHAQPELTQHPLQPGPGHEAGRALGQGAGGSSAAGPRWRRRRRLGPWGDRLGFCRSQACRWGQPWQSHLLLGGETGEQGGRVVGSARVSGWWQAWQSGCETGEQGVGLWGVPESLDDDRLDSQAVRQVSKGLGLLGVPESQDDDRLDSQAVRLGRSPQPCRGQGCGECPSLWMMTDLTVGLWDRWARGQGCGECLNLWMMTGLTVRLRDRWARGQGCGECPSLWARQVSMGVGLWGAPNPPDDGSPGCHPFPNCRAIGWVVWSAQVSGWCQPRQSPAPRVRDRWV